MGIGRQTLSNEDTQIGFMGETCKIATPQLTKKSSAIFVPHKKKRMMTSRYRLGKIFCMSTDNGQKRNGNPRDEALVLKRLQE